MLNGIIQRAPGKLYHSGDFEGLFARMLLLHRQQTDHVWLLPPKVRIVLVTFNKRPIGGKIKRAIALRINIVPKDTDI